MFTLQGQYEEGAALQHIISIMVHKSCKSFSASYFFNHIFLVDELDNWYFYFTVPLSYHYLLTVLIILSQSVGSIKQFINKLLKKKNTFTSEANLNHFISTYIYYFFRRFRVCQYFLKKSF